jgi:hypothetical protein
VAQTGVENQSLHTKNGARLGEQCFSFLSVKEKAQGAKWQAEIKTSM